MKKTLPLIGILLVIVGISGLAFSYHNTQAQPIGTSQNHAETSPKPVVTSSVSISGHPERIIIPRLNIDIPVIDGVYNTYTRTWNLTADKAQFALITPEPNTTAGNTFIYGHNTKQVFSRLLESKLDDKVIVKTSNDHSFTYQLQSSRQTVPSDDSLFRYQGAPILTLQTCSGSNFQYRYLLTYKLIEAH